MKVCDLEKLIDETDRISDDAWVNSLDDRKLKEL